LVFENDSFHVTYFTTSAILHWSGSEATACCTEALGTAALPAEFTVVDYGHWLSVSATHWSSGSPTYKYMLPKAWQTFGSGFVCNGTARGPECMRDTLPPSFSSALKPSLITCPQVECKSVEVEILAMEVT
jgi:hypothetical protein